MGVKKGNTASAVWELAQPYAEELGLEIWDVKFVKEGAQWYLRILIDKPEGVTVEDCEALSRAVDAPLDELDPIEQGYVFEVSSPGLERELSIPAHFEAMAGCNVVVKLFRAIDGSKEIYGELKGLEDGKIVLITEENQKISIDRKDAVLCKVCLSDEELFGGIE